jgi:hypothetical protein
MIDLTAGKNLRYILKALLIMLQSFGKWLSTTRPDHDQQHCYHHAPTVKPDAATAVVELLMMGVRTPETCWAVHKRQVINLRNCCIWLVDLLEFLSFLIFYGPYIVIYLHNINQQDALFYSKFISTINLYVFRTSLLLIIRRYYSVYTAVGIIMRVCRLALVGSL